MPLSINNPQKPVTENDKHDRQHSSTLARYQHGSLVSRTRDIQQMPDKKRRHSDSLQQFTRPPAHNATMAGLLAPGSLTPPAFPSQGQWLTGGSRRIQLRGQLQLAHGPKARRLEFPPALSGPWRQGLYVATFHSASHSASRKNVIAPGAKMAPVAFGGVSDSYESLPHEVHWV